MKQGDVLRKERQNKGLSVKETAEHLGISQKAYKTMEAGKSAAETVGPLLAQIAIQLETPTSRLLAESGRAADTRKGQAGSLIRKHRERRDKSTAEMAEALGISEEDYHQIEEGGSELEIFGPRLLAFAELIEQPVFNLFYPCGLPFQELDDYP